MRPGLGLAQPRPSTPAQRVRLLEDIDVTEHRMELAGTSTAVLVGGDGPPIVLLHGPGESGVSWRLQIPGLAKDHRVVIPDLIAHGETDVPAGEIDEKQVFRWLDELIERTCPAPPVVVGHVLGGSIAVRYAAEHGDRLAGLVLVDTVGLARFRPAPGFALAFLGFVSRPTEGSYERWMGRCAHDLDAMKKRMGDDWEPFVSYMVRMARSEKAKAGARLFRRLGVPRIPHDRLSRITVPTSLIWGRHDPANRLKVAEAASARYDWPLHVVEEAGADPMHDSPEGFLRALRSVLEPHSLLRAGPGAVRTGRPV